MSAQAAPALWDHEVELLHSIDEGHSLQVISWRLGVSTMTVRRQLVIMRDFGLAYSDGTGWRLTDRGREAVQT